MLMSVQWLGAKALHGILCTDTEELEVFVLQPAWEQQLAQILLLLARRLTCSSKMPISTSNVADLLTRAKRTHLLLVILVHLALIQHAALQQFLGENGALQLL